MAVKITRDTHSSAALRRYGRRSKDGAQAARLFAIADVMDGRSRGAAAEHHGMTRQTLRDWVHRYNDEGLEGLCNRTAPGRKPKIGQTALKALREIVMKGPDIQKDGVSRWRLSDLKAWLEHEHGIVCDEETVSRTLKRLGFTRLTARPVHLKQDAETIETFKKNFPAS